TTTEVSCSLSTWAEWREWSDCSDTCGSCGTRQRFRACNKSRPDCLCEGTAYEKEVCNRAVCKYPRPTACCAGYTAASYQGQFYCMSTAARPVIV
ncbi:thrombospondin type 1 domain protein, partial [Ostertagia ostertagi]